MRKKMSLETRPKAKKKCLLMRKYIPDINVTYFSKVLPWVHLCKGETNGKTNS